MNHKKLFAVLMITIIILGIFIIINIPKILLTTVFTLQNSTGKINSPQEIGECHQIGGIVIPKEFNCPQFYIEFGNAGTENICCVQDNCQGQWVRVFNQSIQAFEKICN